MKLTKHFSLSEATKSYTASRHNIDNSIRDEEIYSNVLKTATELLEPIRCHFGIPFSPGSFYRCPELNKATGGSNTSDHLTGQAVDCEIPSVHNIDLGIYIYENLEFDQLIFEHVDLEDPKAGWIHASYNDDRNKKQVLQAKRNSKGKTYYVNLTEEQIYGLLR